MKNEYEKNNEDLLLSLKAKSLRQEKEAEDSLLDSLDEREENTFFRGAPRAGS